MGPAFVATIGSVRFEISELNEQQIAVNGRSYHYDFKQLDSGVISLILDGKVFTIGVAREPVGTNPVLDGIRQFALTLGAIQYNVQVEDERTHVLRKISTKTAAGSGVMVIRAPMPGLIARIEIQQGSEVSSGSGILVLEAMKMENEIRSPMNGRVTEIHVVRGRAVEKGEPLVTIVAN